MNMFPPDTGVDARPGPVPESPHAWRLFFEWGWRSGSGRRV